MLNVTKGAHCLQNVCYCCAALGGPPPFSRENRLNLTEIVAVHRMGVFDNLTVLTFQFPKEMLVVVHEIKLPYTLNLSYAFNCVHIDN